MRSDHRIDAARHATAGPRSESYPSRSKVHVYRLADVAPTTPFYANLTTLQLIPRHRRNDYLDVVLVVGGNGHHVCFTPNGERYRRLVPGQIVSYRPADEPPIASLGLRDPSVERA